VIKNKQTNKQTKNKLAVIHTTPTSMSRDRGDKQDMSFLQGTSVTTGVLRMRDFVVCVFASQPDLIKYKSCGSALATVSEYQ
jgi:hypothetical protein